MLYRKICPLLRSTCLASVLFGLFQPQGQPRLGLGFLSSQIRPRFPAEGQSCLAYLAYLFDFLLLHLVRTMLYRKICPLLRSTCLASVLFGLFQPQGQPRLRANLPVQHCTLLEVCRKSSNCLLWIV
jgi:hypothetical protein